MLKRLLARVVRSPRFQSLLARLSSVGAAPALNRPDAAMFGEGSGPDRRISELEAERDALVQQMVALRQRIAELERRGSPPVKR